MDGLNFKCSRTILSDYFRQDKFGSFIPDKTKLRMSTAEDHLKKQLNADTDFYQRLANICYRTDVVDTDNPHGNTPTFGVGFKLVGKRPLNASARDKDKRWRGEGQKFTDQLKNRESKIEAIHNELSDVHTKLEPTLSTKQEHLLWKVEGDQKNTGGGYDGNHVGGVTSSALNFVNDSSKQIDYEDSELSSIVVDGCLWVKQLIKDSGVAFGSIKPQGASVVRANQDNDGMFGYPILAPGYKEWDLELAKRALIEYGVATDHLVGSSVYDKTKGLTRKFSVIDAAGYIIDNKVFSADDMVSLVVLLARIQKHGWKYEDGKLVAKDGKTRSVYPNAWIPAVIEGMIMAPFNDKLQEVKCKILPSVQDKPTRVEMIRRMITDAIQNKYDYLAADWSKYDASVKGSILATIIQEMC